jgi:hypothetical protein
MKYRVLSAVLLMAAALGLAGCSAAAMLSDRDAAAISTLAEVAGPTSGIEADQIASTECWLPSDHPIVDPTLDSDTLWKVICRVHFSDESGDRYRDTTCVGDFDFYPMLNHCYRYAYYENAPRFEDFAAISNE